MFRFFLLMFIYGDPNLGEVFLLLVLVLVTTLDFTPNTDHKWGYF
jgi:hypothetical protein